jgi:hypothetical protein
MAHGDPAPWRSQATHAPIFVGGLQRSGTTLMRTLLDRHPHIAGIPEEARFLQDERFELFFSGLLVQYSKRCGLLGIGAAELDHAVAAFVDSLFAPYTSRKGAHRWAEKTTTNILRIDYLSRLFPDAQFIHMIRDPRDILCSRKQGTARRKPQWAMFTAEIVAPEWVRRITAGLPWRGQPERYLEVRYEHLAHDPEATLRRVLAFLGEPWCPAVLDAAPEDARVAKPLRPVFASSIGRWKSELSREEVACIQSIAGDTMALLGYEVEAV